MDDPEKSATPGTHDTGQSRMNDHRQHRAHTIQGEGQHKVKTKHRKLKDEQLLCILKEK
jgi:hypothetical protein